MIAICGSKLVEAENINAATASPVLRPSYYDIGHPQVAYKSDIG
jgi:hypothetical protein